MKKKFIMSALLPLFMFVTPAQAAVDISPTVRSMSDIRAQYEAIVVQLEKVRDLLVAQSLAAQSTAPATTDLVISIDGAVYSTVDASAMNKAQATQACEAVAYNTDYMWQLVTCVYQGEEIYNDVFIAG